MLSLRLFNYHLAEYAFQRMSACSSIAHLGPRNYGSSATGSALKMSRVTRRMRQRSIVSRSTDAMSTCLLSPLGEDQAHALGQWFARDFGAQLPEVILSSPYRRPIQTAQLFRAKDGAAATKTICLDERLREKELAILNGLMANGVARLEPVQSAFRDTLGNFIAVLRVAKVGVTSSFASGRLRSWSPFITPGNV